MRQLLSENTIVQNLSEILSYRDFIHVKQHRDVIRFNYRKIAPEL